MSQQQGNQRLKDLRRSIFYKENLYKLKRPEVLKKHDFLTEQQPKWRGRRSDMTDYFNYGFNELTFQLYINKLDYISEQFVSKLQQEYAPKNKIFKISSDNIPLDFGGLQTPFDSRFFPNIEPDIYQHTDDILYNQLEPYFSTVQQLLSEQDPQQYFFNSTTRFLNLQTEGQIPNINPPPPPPPTTAKDDLIMIQEMLESEQVKKQKSEGPIEGEGEPKMQLPIKKEKKQKKKDKKSKKDKKKKHKKKHKKHKSKKTNQEGDMLDEQIKNGGNSCSSDKDFPAKSEKYEVFNSLPMELGSQQKSISPQLESHLSEKEVSIKDQKISEKELSKEIILSLNGPSQQLNMNQAADVVFENQGDEQKQKPKGKDWPIKYIQGYLQRQKSESKIRQ